MTKEEILRKRNLELVKENNELKDKLVNKEAELRFSKTLVQNNVKIRDELLEALNIAYEMRDKYHALLKEMQEFKKTVKGRNAIERWVFDLKRK